MYLTTVRKSIVTRFLKTMLWFKVWKKLAVFWTKHTHFSPIFWRKYLKNHNIGPYSLRPLLYIRPEAAETMPRALPSSNASSSQTSSVPPGTQSWKQNLGPGPDRAQARHAGSGFYYINQKPKPGFGAKHKSIQTPSLHTRPGLQKPKPAVYTWPNPAFYRPDPALLGSEAH
jgi:hypothetical protein